MKRMRFVLGLLTGVLLVIRLALPTVVLAQESAATTEAEASAEQAATETAPPTEAGTTPEEESPESPPSAEAEPTQVEIDIKPGSDPNSINLKSKGVVPVAVVTTDDFDASAVDPEAVVFAEASPVRWTMEDVDGDGDMDMLFHFKTQDLDLAEDSSDATLTGETLDEMLFEGKDTVNIVPKGKTQ